MALSTPPNDSTLLGSFSWNCVSSGLACPRKPGYETGWRTLPYLLLEWASNGRILLERRGTEPILIKPGELFYVEPGRWHRLVMHPCGPMRTNWLLFSCSDSLGRSLMSQRKNAIIPGSAGKRIRMALHSALRLRHGSGKKGLAGQVELKWLEIDILHRLLAAIPQAFEMERTLDVRIETALHFIRDNFARVDIGRTEISMSMCLSPSRCHAVFVEKTGRAPGNHLRQVRIREAQRLLLLSDLSVEEVARRCGFEESPYFCRCFRRNTGQTPAMYRKMARYENAGTAEAVS